MANNMSTYVLTFVSDNLLWYDKDGLMTWYD